MAVTPEEQRLLDYQAQQARIAERDRARRRELRGDPVAKRDLDSRWAPLQRWLQEREPGSSERPWS